MSLEDNIINSVSKYPGTDMIGFSDLVMRTANVLVAQERLCIRYNGARKLYYTPEQIAEKDAEDTKVYLAASRHRDGTIHIYLKGKDVGMRIRPSPSEDHMIITTDDDSFGLVKLSDVARLRNKISEQTDRIGELSDDIKQVEKVYDASRDTTNEQSARIDELISEKICLSNRIRRFERVSKLDDGLVRKLYVDAIEKRDETSIVDAAEKKIRRLKLDITDYMDTINKQSRRIDQLLDERIRNVKTIASKQERIDSLVRDSEVLSSALAASAQRAYDLEEIAEDDADAWKKREYDLLEMISDRDATLSSMNAALCRLLRIAERNDILAKDNMFRELYMGRDTGVFKDVDMP